MHSFFHNFLVNVPNTEIMMQRQNGQTQRGYKAFKLQRPKMMNLIENIHKSQKCGKVDYI